METIQLNIDKALGSVTKEQVFAYEKEVAESMEKLHKGTGKGKFRCFGQQKQGNGYGRGGISAVSGCSSFRD